MNKATAVLVEEWIRVERPTLDHLTTVELKSLAVEAIGDIERLHELGVLVPWCEALDISVPSWAQDRDIGLT